MDIGLDTAVALWGVFIGLFWVFMYCYIGARISHYFSSVADLAYQTNWYMFPLELRKHFILIIRQSQVSFTFDGLKLFDCNLITFTSVSAA